MRAMLYCGGEGALCIAMIFLGSGSWGVFCPDEGKSLQHWFLYSIRSRGKCLLGLRHVC